MACWERTLILQLEVGSTRNQSFTEYTKTTRYTFIIKNQYLLNIEYEIR